MSWFVATRGDILILAIGWVKCVTPYLFV